MTGIDAKQAASAWSDIEAMAHRVRQSTIYQLSSLLMIMWGALTFAGYLVTYLSPRHAGIAWPSVYIAGIAGSFAASAFGYTRTRVRAFDFRMLAAFLLFVAFGSFCCWLGPFTPRHFGTFLPDYFMLLYPLCGLWG